MDTYWKALCISLVGVLLCLILSKNAKDYSTVIVIVLCCALSAAAIAFLAPVLRLMDRLVELSGTGTAWLQILMKSAGLSFIGETVASVCADAGQSAVGKTLQLLTTVAIMWISLPLIENLMDLIQSVLEML